MLRRGGAPESFGRFSAVRPLDSDRLGASTSIGVRLSAVDLERLDTIAAERGLTRSAMVRALISEAHAATEPG